MKTLLFASLLLALSTGNAFALKCERLSLEFSFQEFAKSDKSYIMVQGTLSDQRDIITAPLDDDGNDQGRIFTATFTGWQGDRAGFTKPLTAPVNVRETCMGPWCGAIGIDPQEPVLAFFEVTPYGYRLDEGPCGGAVFYHPDNKTINNALRCLRGGICAPH